jgi:hypothetical protein
MVKSTLAGGRGDGEDRAVDFDMLWHVDFNRPFSKSFCFANAVQSNRHLP